MVLESSEVVSKISQSDSQPAWLKSNAPARCRGDRGGRWCAERKKSANHQKQTGCCNQATSSVDLGNISDTMSSLLVKHCDSPAAAAAHYRSSGGDHAHRAVYMWSGKCHPQEDYEDSEIRHPNDQVTITWWGMSRLKREGEMILLLPAFDHLTFDWGDHLQRWWWWIENTLSGEAKTSAV